MQGTTKILTCRDVKTCSRKDCRDTDRKKISPWRRIPVLTDLHRERTTRWRTKTYIDHARGLRDHHGDAGACAYAHETRAANDIAYAYHTHIHMHGSACDLIQLAEQFRKETFLQTAKLVAPLFRVFSHGCSVSKHFPVQITNEDVTHL